MRQAFVGIDAPIAQERPVAPNIFEMFHIDLRKKNLFFVDRTFYKHHTLWIGYEGRAPELDAWSCLVGFLMPDAINRGNVKAVGDCVTALHSLPCISLSLAVLFLLAGVPADSGWIEQNRGPLEC